MALSFEISRFLLLATGSKVNFLSEYETSESEVQTLFCLKENDAGQKTTASLFKNAGTSHKNVLPKSAGFLTHIAKIKKIQFTTYLSGNIPTIFFVQDKLSTLVSQ